MLVYTEKECLNELQFKEKNKIRRMELVEQRALHVS